jgi:inward rectifier potassium channel
MAQQSDDKTSTLDGPASSVLVQQEQARQDLGFGTKLNESYSRLINKDGSFNVARAGGPFWNRVNLYHKLITMSWTQFLGLVVLFYTTVNAIFAGLYVLVGVQHLKGLTDQEPMAPFWGAFFFSAQTLTTVGYGHIAPMGYTTGFLSAIESLIGLLAFALVTGLLYGRFSRPVARIRFSKQAVFAPYLDTTGFMFRIVNERSNQLIDLSVEITLSRLETKADGSPFRKYYALPLERNKVNFFPLSWTLVHPITDASPLDNCTPENMAASETEFLILFRAMDDTFSQTVHTRYSYRYDEVVWGYKFRPMFDGADQGHGMLVLDLDKLDEMDPAPLT